MIIITIDNDYLNVNDNDQKDNVNNNDNNKNNIFWIYT